eukprot:13535817-Alexandrium_andersonii.AAC.1
MGPTRVPRKARPLPHCARSGRGPNRAVAVGAVLKRRRARGKGDQSAASICQTRRSSAARPSALALPCL